jgi:hypothetical protein
MRAIHQAVLAAAISFALAQLTFAGTPREGPLSRSVVLPATHASLSDYLVAVLRTAKVSGGIGVITEGCEETSERFPESSGTIQSLLNRLTTSGHHDLRWTQLGDHLVVWSGEAAPKILRVVVPDFRFSRKEPLVRASSDLFGSEAVRSEMQKLNMVERRGPWRLAL